MDKSKRKFVNSAGRQQSRVNDNLRLQVSSGSKLKDSTSQSSRPAPTILRDRKLG